MKVSRKAGVKYMCVALLSAGMFFCGQWSFAADPAMEQIGNFGTIDWVGQKLSARGVGVPGPDIQSPGQARAMAQRAAVVDARRNLLEVIKGVHIDSTTRVENFMVKDDSIVAKVQGMLNFSSVDGVQTFADGTVEATVSIPLAGQLSQVLLSPAIRAGEKTTPAEPAPGLENKIRELEQRIRILEEHFTRLQRLGAEQQQTILFFKQFIAAWIDYQAGTRLIQAAGAASDTELATLKNKFMEQENRMSLLAQKLDSMAKRLSDLEGQGDRKKPVKPSTQTKTADLYTGLVIDARGTGFRPCLKPEIYSGNNLVYPGDYVDLKKVVRTGYVRYYRKVDRAQQSDQSGSLPYTIKSRGTQGGDRGLSIGPEEFNTLKSYIQSPGSFMADGKVVIVF
ncbi:MAG: hypothetical protein Q8P24_18610 [Desulfobacterales bacterium]|nr:hypothetical protein [Desulfobacterales bacterium]